jgi:hypothetical protein
VIGPEPPFTISVTHPPVTLRWPASAGRQYDILGTSNLSTPFQLQDSIIPTNSMGYWIDTNASDSRRFYRIRAVP